MLFRCWKINITKNTITAFSNSPNGFYCTRDFTKDFFFSDKIFTSTVYETEPHNLELYHFYGNIISTSFDELVQIVYYAYIDYVRPRRFVGFEDINIATVSIDD